MAGHSYVNKGYSTYTDVPAQEGGYAHGLKQSVNWYVVETTRIERIHTPAARYLSFGDQEYIHAPSTLIRPKYAPTDHHEGYEPDYGSDYENSSPPRYHGRESLMDKFLNKIQIKASRPVKTSNLSSPNKYHPTSPVRSYPSEEAHLIRSRNLSGPNKYQPTSPVHNHPSEETHMIKNRNLSGPNKYQPTSPVHNHPTEETHLITNQNLSGPNKYQPTSPVHNHPSEETHLIRNRNLSGPNKYQPTSPVHNHPSEETRLIRNQNLSGPNKYQPTSPVHSYPSEEAHLIRTKNLPGPNKHHPSSPGSEGGRHGKTGPFSGTNNHWLTAGPPATHHPLTTSTNDINEALSFLEASVNYSPHSGPKRTRVFNNLSPRAQSIEPERRYTKPAFVGATTQPHFRTNTIDSQEAMRKYQGTLVP